MTSIVFLVNSILIYEHIVRFLYSSFMFLSSLCAVLKRLRRLFNLIVQRVNSQSYVDGQT